MTKNQTVTFLLGKEKYHFALAKYHSPRGEYNLRDSANITKQKGELLPLKNKNKKEKIMKKTNYLEPVLEIERFSMDDVLSASSDANFDVGDLLSEEGL